MDCLQEKLSLLKRKKRVQIYDKKLVMAIAQELGHSDIKMCCIQNESCFECWIPNNLELMNGYKKWCKINNYNPNGASYLQEWLKGGAIIWKKA